MIPEGVRIKRFQCPDYGVFARRHAFTLMLGTIRNRLSGRDPSAPAESGRDLCQDRLNDVCIIGDAELIWDRQQNRVGFCDGLILPELLDEDVWFGSIASSE